MSVFNFLKRIAQGDEKPGGGVFEFLNNVVQKPNKKKLDEMINSPQGQALIKSNPELAKAVQTYQGGAPQGAIAGATNMAVGAGRYIARTPETVIRSIADPFITGEQTGQVTDPFRKLLYGKEPVETYQKRIAGNQALGGTIGALAIPLGVVGGLLDVSGIGGIYKNLGQSGLRQLAKTTTAEQATKILTKSGMADDMARSLSPAIAKTKDPNIIKNMIDKAVSPAPTRFTPETPPTSVISDIKPAGQGTYDFMKAPMVDPDERLIIDALSGKPAALGQTPVAGIKNLRTQQEAIYKAGRGQKVATAKELSTGLVGEEGLIAKKQGLYGAMEKVRYAGISDKIGVPEANALYKRLYTKIEQDPDLDFFSGLNLQDALHTVVYGGRVLQPAEIMSLENRYGKQFADAIKENIQSEIPKLTKWQEAGQVLGVPRAWLASGDISGGGRQGIAALATHPSLGKNLPDQIKFLKNEKNFLASQSEIAARPNFGRAQQSKLAILDPSSINPNITEEKFVSHLSEKVPGIGRMVHASNRAYTGVLNRIRMDYFDHLIDKAGRAGLDIDNPELLNGISKVINNSTGRGDFGKFLEQHGGALSAVFFAPRLMASRINMFNPAYYMSLPKFARHEAYRQAASMGSYALSVLTLAKLAGAEVSLDPTNSDFGKIKVGDTRLDILGGHQQYIRLGASLAMGKITSSQTGKATEFGGGFGKPNAYDVTMNFLTNKENPILNLLTTVAKGKDISGAELGFTNEDAKGISKYAGGGTYAQQVMQRFIPLAWQDIGDLFTHPKSAGGNVLGKLGAGAATLVGVGAQTYGKQDIPISDKQKATLKLFEQSGVPAEDIKSYKSFFQTLKTGPDRVGESENINKALAQNNTEQAQAIANEYNQKVLENLKSWLEANRGKQIPKAVYEALNSSLINLTSASIKSRLQSIVENPDKYNLKLGGVK